jgi:hypothetical protein
MLPLSINSLNFGLHIISAICILIGVSPLSIRMLYLMYRLLWVSETHTCTTYTAEWTHAASCITYINIILHVVLMHEAPMENLHVFRNINSATTINPVHEPYQFMHWYLKTGLLSSLVWTISSHFLEIRG